MRYNENKVYYLPCLRYSSRFILSATKSNCNNCNTRFREINTFLTGSIEIRAFLTFHSQNLCLKPQNYNYKFEQKRTNYFS